MAIEVFNRYEQKYMIDTKKMMLLQNDLSDYMELDAYNRKNKTYSITNIYYDTNDSQLIRSSLAKPIYKEKLRLRSYGKPRLDSKVYMEIKKKCRGLVNKRRSSIKLNDAYRYLETGIMPDYEPYMNRQVLCEIGYLLEQYKLYPMLYLSYDRRAYFSNDQYDMRISFDTNILTRRTDLRLESGIYGEPLLPDEKWIMEIKVSRSMPVWLAHLLAEYKIYPLSYSKYGTEYMNTLANQANQEYDNYEFNPAKINRGILVPA